MADPISIKHAFVLTKPNSADASIVSSNAWNADEKISGGQDGQLMARNSAVASGGSYVQGPRIFTAQESYSGPATSSTPPMASVTVTCTTNCDILLLANVATLLSAGAAVTIAIRRDAVNIAVRNLRGGNSEWSGFHESFAESPSTHTYDIIASGVSGNITAATVKLSIVPLGKL